MGFLQSFERLRELCSSSPRSECIRAFILGQHTSANKNLGDENKKGSKLTQVNHNYTNRYIVTYRYLQPSYQEVLAKGMIEADFVICMIRYSHITIFRDLGNSL